MAGALDRIRTYGFLLRRQTLYPLSYEGTVSYYTMACDKFDPTVWKVNGIMGPVSIERMSYGSAGIGKLSDGRVVFVEGAIPGDVVEITITKDQKSFAKAVVSKLISSSPLRVEPLCTRLCTGCPWRDISYDAQLAFKRSHVVEALVRVGGFKREEVEELVVPTKPSPKQWGYRNKIELATQISSNNRLSLGFHRSQSHDVLPVDACPVAVPTIANSPRALRGSLGFSLKDNLQNLIRIGVRGSNRTSSLEVALWMKPSGCNRKLVASTISQSLPTTSIVRVISDPGKKRQVKKVEVLDGLGAWKERLLSYQYLTSAPSFFQVNSDQCESMIQIALEWINPDQEDLIADLYSGGGTFSIPFAAAGAETIAIEMAGSSVKDLRRNAERNRVFIDVIGGDTEREIALLDSCDAILVDPPRAGLTTSVIRSLGSIGAQKLIYVSCDPQTLARDAKQLQAEGYQLSKVQPVDMFPQTYHVETMCLFTQGAAN